MSRRNARLTALRAMLEQRVSTIDVPRDMPSWAALVPEPKTGALDFERFPFQRELYAEATDDRELVVMKGTQLGISTWALRWILFHADVHGRTGLYVFPTKADVLDFSAARIKRVIRASEYLRGRRPAGGPNARGLIAVGRGIVYFRGSEAERGLDSVDADILVLDEYDTLNQQNIPDAERRITSATSAGLIRRVGVPSAASVGIAALYERSARASAAGTCAARGAVSGRRPPSSRTSISSGCASFVGRAASRSTWRAVSGWPSFPTAPFAGTRSRS